ncbi:MAG: NAD(P)H-hydrate dehydratase [Clostridiales bacterium]|nr:NAD(P)H-hydrate dehydratase [Clostridiales bacterium]
MINVLTADEVRHAERELEKSGVSISFMRMNASLALAECLLPRAKKDRVKTAVFCGAGGNGYDGVLAAARLKHDCCDVTAYLVGDRSKFSVEILRYAENEGLDLRAASEYAGGADIIVDAIFGIGLNRAIDGECADLINKLNADNAFKVAVDIPSGLNADTGEIMGVAFKADFTVTFSCYKRGMLFGSGKDICGGIVVEEVGIPTSSNVRVFDGEDFKPFKRKPTAHKGTSGRVFVIGGCGTMIGAPILAGSAAHAAYLNGAGTVTVCLPKVHRNAAAARATMSMMKFLDDTTDGFILFDKISLDDIISRATAIDIGMGMGETPDLKKIISYLCDNFGGTLVIDADGLNAISGDYLFLKNSKCNVVLTPHVGEFTRLTGKPANIENAVALANDTGAIVTLKSATTIITDGNEVRLNIAGTPAMAKGGTGDVLGGCITALSCAYSAFDAASIACYRNGMGAERAVSAYSQMMLTPRDILRYAEYEEK